MTGVGTELQVGDSVRFSRDHHDNDWLTARGTVMTVGGGHPFHITVEFSILPIAVKNELSRLWGKYYDGDRTAVFWAYYLEKVPVLDRLAEL